MTDTVTVDTDSVVFEDGTETIEFKEGVEYKTTFPWGVGYVITESDAFDDTLVRDDTSGKEVQASIFADD